MNITEKYKIKMMYDQFGHNVSENYEENDEKIAIDLFEEHVLQLKSSGKNQYSMIELGSNYSYYSMLFKKIIQPYKSFSLMVDPYENIYN